MILDYDRKVEDGTLRAHAYLIPYNSILYVLDFITNSPDASFKFYDRIAKSFEFYEPPVVEGIKKYLSPDGNITMEIPANWKTLPPSPINNELIRFGTPQTGLTADIYNPEHTPWESLENFRTRLQEGVKKIGWKDFVNSETVTNGRKLLILDSKKGSTNIRNYFFKEGDYIYSLLFYAFNTEGIPADKIQAYERVMKSINIIRIH